MPSHQLMFSELEDVIAEMEADAELEAAEEAWGMYMCTLLAEALTAPVIAPLGGQWVGAELVTQHSGDIQIQRMMLLMRHQKDVKARVEAATGDREKLLAIYKERWRLPMTWWELTFQLSEASMRGPLSHDAFVAYQWCFAHCFSLQEYMEVHDTDTINVGALETFFYSTPIAQRKRQLPPLDGPEREWLEEFNTHLLKVRLGAKEFEEELSKHIEGKEDTNVQMDSEMAGGVVHDRQDLHGGS